jgi:hypothetical protein
MTTKHKSFWAGLLAGIAALFGYRAATKPTPKPVPPVAVTTTIQPPPTSTTTPKPWLVPRYEANYYAPQVDGDPIRFLCQAWITLDRKDMANGICYWVPSSVRARDAGNIVIGSLVGKDGQWFCGASNLPVRFWIDVVCGSEVFIYYVADKSKDALIKPVVQKE